MARALDVDVLRTFHAVARFGRFKDAAGYVNRSPSAVTTQIQKLEELVGQRLFNRNNQLVELTQFGRRLLADTTEFLLSHDRLLASLSPQLLKGKLRLGVPDSYAAGVMTDLLPVFVMSNPSLQLEVEARSSGELFSLFSRHLLDITLVVSPQRLSQGELICTTSPCWVASREFKYDPDMPLPIAVQLQGCPYRDAAIDALRKVGLPHRVLLESASSQAVDATIRSGLAIGLMETGMLNDSLTANIEGLLLPALPKHYIYLLSDADNPGAMYLQGLLTRTFKR
ncbi:LysR substrate-binding domain-containing protein [Pseudomonas syringae]|uniref:LysR substrate-binding domain-containing protein n=1 Tax=Pseudomonas syringae TaxID=317 RepID=UPI00028E4E9D|nr:LysR substrate-binding domain-containing protein [Pseudomonas syringae]EKG37738.1 putative transcriptional regulator lrhA [Pseudomonas syringae pv. avellanae str. ISPaVe037]